MHTKQRTIVKLDLLRSYASGVFVRDNVPLRRTGQAVLPPIFAISRVGTIFWASGLWAEIFFLRVVESYKSYAKFQNCVFVSHVLFAPLGASYSTTIKFALGSGLAVRSVIFHDDLFHSFWWQTCLPMTFLAAGVHGTSHEVKNQDYSNGHWYQALGFGFFRSNIESGGGALRSRKHSVFSKAVVLEWGYRVLRWGTCISGGCKALLW